MRVWKSNQTGAQAFLGYLAQPTVDTERLFLQQSSLLLGQVRLGLSC